MTNIDEKRLTITQRLDLIRAIFARESIRPALDCLSDNQLVQAHAFLWDKLVEIHYVLRSEEFNRENVTKDMMPSLTYQTEQGCDLRLDYCKGVECIWSHPVCAGKKIKNNMEVMAAKIGFYLEHPEKYDVVKLRETKKRLDLWVT